jgi:uncharacterized peroxidase-related enzyme
MSTHAAVAVLGLDAEVVKAALADWGTAPISPKLRAALGFLEVLTLRPDAVTVLDIRPLRAVGLSDAAIREAIYVCFLFNVLNRLSAALQFEMPSKAGIRRIGQAAHRLGYAITILPG